MAFSKSFPRAIPGSNYPRWEEVSLTEEEEKEQEEKCRSDNIRLMRECIDDAKILIEGKGFKGFKEINTVYYDPAVITIEEMEATLKKAKTYLGTAD